MKPPSKPAVRKASRAPAAAAKVKKPVTKAATKVKKLTLHHGTTAKTTKGTKTPSEHADQVKLVMHVRTFYPGVVIAAVPNGAAVTGLQRMRLVAEGLLPGFPDLIVCEPVKPWHGLMVEMKSTAATAAVSAKQLAVHAALREKGYRVVVARGYAEAKEIVAEYLKGRRITPASAPATTTRRTRTGLHPDMSTMLL